MDRGGGVGAVAYEPGWNPRGRGGECKVGGVADRRRLRTWHADGQPPPTHLVEVSGLAGHVGPCDDVERGGRRQERVVGLYGTAAAAAAAGSLGGAAAGR